MIVVVGGSIAAVLMSFPLKNFLCFFGVMKKVFLNKQSDISELIEQIVSLAETARRDGLLALESRVDELENPFIVLGVQMAVDGTRPEVIEDILRTELDAVATRHRDGKAILDQMGRFAPAFGMIGTLMGLIIMLGNMEDPSSIGSGMAVALITTLYGANSFQCGFPSHGRKARVYQQAGIARHGDCRSRHHGDPVGRKPPGHRAETPYVCAAQSSGGSAGGRVTTWQSKKRMRDQEFPNGWLPSAT